VPEDLVLLIPYCTPGYSSELIQSTCHNDNLSILYLNVAFLSFLFHTLLWIVTQQNYSIVSLICMNLFSLLTDILRYCINIVWAVSISSLLLTHQCHFPVPCHGFYWGVGGWGVELSQDNCLTLMLAC